MITTKELLEKGKANVNEVLELFDSLPEVSEEFMIGRWAGGEIGTNHPMDGMLQVSGWYGKIFQDLETVHPLVFFSKDKKELFAVDPSKVPMQIELPKSEILETLLHIGKPFIQTTESKARLRMVEYRNKITATMCYDEKAIFDHFAKIDENTVLGVMDLKGVPQPYFFYLKRDDQTPYKLNF